MSSFIVNHTTTALAITTVFTNSTGDLSRQRAMAVAFHIFGYCTIVLVLVGFCGNVLMIVSMFHGRLYRHITNQLLINLFVVGAIYSTFAMPPAAYSTINLRWDADPGSCKFFAFMALSGCFVCCLIHAAIAIARYLAVVHINHISKRIQDRIGIVMMVLTWLMPYVVFIFPFFKLGAVWGYKTSVQRCQFSSVVPLYTNIYRAMFQVVPIILMCICYCLIIFKVCLVRTAVSRKKTRDALRFKSRFSVELGIAKRTGAVAAFFIICFIPSTIWSYIPGSITVDLAENVGPALYLLMWFGVTCSYMAYLQVNPDLRYAVRSLLKRLRLWPTSRAVGPAIIIPGTDFNHHFTERSKSTRVGHSPRPPITEHTTGSAPAFVFEPVPHGKQDM